MLQLIPDEEKLMSSRKNYGSNRTVLPHPDIFSGFFREIGILFFRITGKKFTEPYFNTLKFLKIFTVVHEITVKNFRVSVENFRVSVKKFRDFRENFHGSLCVGYSLRISQTHTMRIKKDISIKNMFKVCAKNVFIEHSENTFTSC